MASTKTKNEPRPWYTASFHKTRLAMLLVAVLYFVPITQLSFLWGLMIGWAFIDIKAISAWRNKEVMLPSPAPSGSKQNKNQKMVLLGRIGVFFVCFVLVLAVAFGLIPLGASDFNFILRGLIYLCANVAGWNLVSWIREASAIMRRNDELAIFEQEVVSSALPGVPFTPVYQPATQAQALRLRVGSSGKP